MGRGIGFIPNAINTYHIDYGVTFEEARNDLMERDREEYLQILKEFDTITSKKAYVKNHPFESYHSDSHVWEWASTLQDENVDAIQCNIGYLNVCNLQNALPQNEHRSEWSAEFNGYGRLIAENDDLYVVGIFSTDDDYGVGVVPKKEVSDFADQVYYDHYDKMEWHDARGGFTKFCDNKGEKLFEKYMDKVRAQEEQIVEAINSLYQIRIRTSAWTMSSVLTFEKETA